MTYAILYHPGHNRVYFETAQRLALAEFEIAAGGLSVPCGELRNESIGGVAYLLFEAEGALTAADGKVLAGLSFVYALFAVERADGAVCLRPLDAARNGFVDEGISSIMKYTGKTNEVFTRMLLNIAYHTQTAGKDGVRLLDPVAGKGTTLYEGLVRGFNVYGIEVGDKVVSEAYHFMKRFLEAARYKYDAQSVRTSGANKSFSAMRHTFEIARTKEDYKAKDTRTFELVAGNSQHAGQFYKKNTFHMVVGDLPYGVQHGNVTNEKQSGLTRNPSELLRTCLPAWVHVLAKGGALVLSWNSHVLPRAEMVKILAAHGLAVKDEGAYAGLAHRVDQAILRDVVAAVKL